MIDVEVTVLGADETIELLQRVEDRAADLTRAWHVIDHKLSDFFHRQFVESGVPGGRPWAPLSDAAKQWRVSKWGTNIGGTDRPLWDTGRLKDSMTTPAGEGFRVIKPERYVRGTTVPYAVTHQEGLHGNAVRQIIPDPVPEAMVLEWSNVIVQHLES